MQKALQSAIAAATWQEKGWHTSRSTPAYAAAIGARLSMLVGITMVQKCSISDRKICCTYTAHRRLIQKYLPARLYTHCGISPRKTRCTLSLCPILMQGICLSQAGAVYMPPGLIRYGKQCSAMARWPHTHTTM